MIAIRCSSFMYTRKRGRQRQKLKNKGIFKLIVRAEVWHMGTSEE
jgi:hypothetical protein